MRMPIQAIKEVAKQPILNRTASYFWYVFAGIVLLTAAIRHEPLAAISRYVNSLHNLATNNVFQSATYFLILTFPLVTYNWLLKNKDITQQLDNASRSQAETIFSNALTLLFKEGDSEADKNARLIGFEELISLKDNKDCIINTGRINRVTSLRINLKDVLTVTILEDHSDA